MHFICIKPFTLDQFMRAQSLKNQADWLLHNIIPRHVSESLKKSAQYSENHREVGIIFASLVRTHQKTFFLLLPIIPGSTAPWRGAVSRTDVVFCSNAWG
jgi:hypothetical protein